MVFLWNYNLILQKLSEYKSNKIGFPIDDFKQFINDYFILRGINVEIIIRLGLLLNLFNKENETIIISPLGEQFLIKSNQDDISLITEGQKELIKKIVRENWILDDLQVFTVKTEMGFLVYKKHRSEFCGTLISLLKSIDLIQELDENFFILSEIDNDYWEKNFKIDNVSLGFHFLLQDYNEYWENFFKRKSFSEEKLDEILKKQKEIGDYGERIAFNKEIELVKEYNKPELIEKVRLISKESIDKGYDIVSVNEDGSEKYVEVKTVSGGNIRFFFSRNEFRVSNQYLKNYWIYIVDLKNNKMMMFNDIKSLIDSGSLFLEPTLYEVRLKDQNSKCNQINLTNEDLTKEGLR